MRGTIVCFLLLACASASTARAQADAAEPAVASFLYQGKIAEGVEAMAARLKAAPDDQQARFGLGFAQTLRAVEKLSQGLYRHGFRGPRGLAFLSPMLRLPIPERANPAEIDYDAARGLLKAWADDLALAEATLAGIKGEVALPLRVGKIRLDLDGDGTATEAESFWGVFSTVSRGGQPADPEERAAAEGFVIRFDTGDAHWLRGYCNLLLALAEVKLAHDARELFERTAHLFFANPKTPYAFLRRPAPQNQGFEFGSIADLVAFLHLMSFPVAEPQRMNAALDRLNKVIECSHRSWDAILAETDNDREWIPNPSQQTVVPEVRVTKEMIDGWREFLAEASDILAGKKLVPFWRTGETRGVNINKVFTQPSRLDLILWVQGTAAVPYLEAGPQATPATWDRFQRLFNGQFVGFAVWFN